jgi:outer membrane protein W
MKKKVTILVSAVTLLFGINSNAQAVSEGNIIIDPYYGYPNFGSKFASSLNGIENSKVTGIGPMGLRAEYMVADKFGIGVDFIYNSFNVSGTIDSLNSDGTLYKSYDAKIYSQRYRPQIRMNYHFVSNDALDAYVGVGVGANIRKIGTKTDYPNYNDNSISGSLIPVSLRLALGMRYYFTDNIGLNLELGLGGPFMSGGLSIKF